MDPKLTVPNDFSGRFPFFILVALYFLSGIVALSYEILWMRLLTNLFGVSTFGVALTVSVFMAGLGFGALLAPRVSSLFRRPLLVFASIELSVACFSIYLPAWIPSLEVFVFQLSDGSSVATFFALESLLIFAILFVPAFFLGVAFVFMIRVLSGRVSLGVVYGMNTLGGVLGALLPLLLLPVFGWAVSLRLVAILGIVLALAVFCAAFIFRRVVNQSEEYENKSVISVEQLFAYAVVGAAAIMLQIAWARLYGMVFLRTEFVVAILIAVYLVGIGLGSSLSRFVPVRSFSFLPLVSVFSIYISILMLTPIAQWNESALLNSLPESLLWQAMILVVVTLPVTLCFGMWFPLLCKRLELPMQSAGVLYGVNSIGAALGALMAAFVFTPAFGSTAVIAIAAALLLSVGLIWNRTAWFKMAVLVFLLPLVFIWPMPEVSRLLPVSQSESRNIFKYEDAVSITDVIERRDGTRMLLSDLQRMDASTDWASIVSQKNQARLPLLLHPEPRNILFLGLGTGITASGSLGFPELERTSVELSRGAIIASTEYFSKANEGIVSRISVVEDDVKRFLVLNRGKFDVILGDLFHPDLIGRSALLSSQHFERVSGHLTDDGIFVQWLALNQFDVASLQTVFRTFKARFPDGVMFLDGFRLALVGSKSHLSASGILGKKDRLTSEQLKLVTGSEGLYSWLGRYLGPLPVGAGRIQSDWEPVLEFEMPALRYLKESPLSGNLGFLLTNRRSVAEAALDLEVASSDFADFESAYLATEMFLRSTLDLLNGQAESSVRLLRLAQAANSKDVWVAMSLADQMYASLGEMKLKPESLKLHLLKVLEVYPDHSDSLLAMSRLERELGNIELALGYSVRFRQLNPYSNIM